MDSSTVIQICQLVVCLSLLIILHEFGHYLTAKWFKTKVEKFYLFFDWPRKIFSKKIGETEWGIGMIPLGGYVKIAGMIDESMDKEQLKQPPQPWEFRSKKPWQRLIIMLGGVTVNFMLAWFIFAMIFTVWGLKYVDADEYQKNGLYFSDAWKKAGFKDGDKIVKIDGQTQSNLERQIIDILLGEKIEVERNGKIETISLKDENIKSILNGTKGGLPYVPIGTVVEIDSIIPNSQAHKAGLTKGDVLIAINGEKKSNNMDFTSTINKNANKEIELLVNRNGKEEIVKATVGKDGRLGFSFQPVDKTNFQKNKKYNFIEAIPVALNETGQKLNYQIKQFKLIIRPKTEAYKQVSGPLRMYKIFAPTWDWEHFWTITAILSVWLAFVNILPIPALDGGHAMFTIYEMVTGKKPTEKTLERAQMIGFAIVMGLTVLVFGNDIWHLIKGT